jgi:hypothetical protein
MGVTLVTAYHMYLYRILNNIQFLLLMVTSSNWELEYVRSCKVLGLNWNAFFKTAILDYGYVDD